MAENPVKPPDCMRVSFISDCRLENFSNIPGGLKRKTWEAATSVKIVQRPGPDSLPSVHGIHAGCWLCLVAGLQHLVPCHRWQGISHAAGGLCIQLLYFHTPVRFLHLPTLSSFPLYFRNSLQTFSSFFFYFFTPKALGILRSSKGACLPHFSSPTHALHMYPLILLSNHTLFSPCFFTRAFIFSLTKDFACPAFLFFFISLQGSQLLPMLRRLDLFSLFWS